MCVSVCINISWIRLRRNRWASVQLDVVFVMHFVFIFVWSMDLLALYRSASVHISRWEDRDHYGCWSIFVILSIGKFSILYFLFIRSEVVIYFFLSKLSLKRKIYIWNLFCERIGLNLVWIDERKWMVQNCVFWNDLKMFKPYQRPSSPPQQRQHQLFVMLFCAITLTSNLVYGKYFAFFFLHIFCWRDCISHTYKCTFSGTL